MMVRVFFFPFTMTGFFIGLADDIVGLVHRCVRR